MRAYRSLSLAVLTLAIAVPSAALAAPKTKVDPALPAYVAIQDLLAAYRKTPGYAKYQAKLRDQAKVYDEEMQVIAQVRYASEPERKEALAIKAKPKPGDDELKRFEELKKKTDAIDNERAALSQKEKPTDADTKRLNELAAMNTEAIKNLNKEGLDRREQLRKMETALMVDVENELLKMVEKMAKEYKLPQIYERRALLFGGQDLTEEAISRLPK
jgi:hypothetical protein